MTIGRNVKKKVHIKQGDNYIMEDYILICRQVSINNFCLEVRYSNGMGEHLANFTTLKDMETYLHKYYPGLKVLLLN